MNGRVSPRNRCRRVIECCDRPSWHPIGSHGGPRPPEPLIGTMTVEEMDRRVAWSQRRGRLLAERARIRRQLDALERRIEANGTADERG